MKRILLLAWLLPCALGAAPDQQEAVRFAPLYRAGEKLLLTYKTEQVLTMPDGVASQFWSMEMPLGVRVSDKAGQVEVAMTARRAVAGQSQARTDEQIRKVIKEFSRQPGVTLSPEEMERYFREIKEATKAANQVIDTQNPQPGHEEEIRNLKEEIGAVDFLATVSEGGTIAGFAAQGKALEAFRKIEDPEYREAHQQHQSGKFRSILEDSLAYLPNKPVRVGQTWEVARPQIFPYNEFAVGMLIGCAAVWEKATCRLEAVRDTPDGQVAVIKVTGHREGVAQFHSAAAGPTANTLESRGEVLFNLKTGRLVSVHIENTARLKPDKDPHMPAVFIDSLTLVPLSN